MNVVVIGYGMVGSRFVDELCAINSPTAPTLTITVLGAEDTDPYNRVLLSEVVAGQYDVTAVGLPTITDPRVTIHTGTSATSINRALRTVVDSTGTTHPYDVLVLATGANARIPNLTGILRTPHPPASAERHPASASLIPGVHVLRTIDDARDIIAATFNTTNAVVLGGGVLGIEAAAALTNRGLDVTLVHPRTLMNTQLDSTASAIAATMLTERGITVHTGTPATGVTTHHNTVTGLTLADGATIPTGLLVLTTGTTPTTTLAHTAGIATDHGILVTPTHSTITDPHIYAIGDCAQPPHGYQGLIAPGWDQARTLAAALHNHTPTPPATTTHNPTDIITVKGTGIDIITMGTTHTQPSTTPPRTLQLTDPHTNRHISLTITNGHITAATCIGAGPVAHTLISTYTHQTPLPHDPAHLLLASPQPSPTATNTPVRIPDTATICRCNGVTKGDLVTAWTNGARSTEDLAHSTRATTGCGGCTDAVCGIAEWLRASVSTTSEHEQSPVLA